MNSSPLEVLRAPSVTWKQVHLQLGAMNTNFPPLFLHVRGAHRCRKYTQVRKQVEQVEKNRSIDH